MSLFGGETALSPSPISSPSAIDSSPAGAPNPASEQFSEDANSAVPSISDRASSSSVSPEPDRLNKFSGLAQTWRRYTALDRQLAASLEQITAGELNIHLYNAHALKRRLLSLDRSRSAELRSWHSKDTWLKQGDELLYTGPDGTEEMELAPGKKWAAWPVESGEVPPTTATFGRDTEPDGLEEWTFGVSGERRASEELGDAVIAVFLKLAKERWESRQWEDADEDDESDAEETRRVRLERRSRSRSKSIMSSSTRGTLRSRANSSSSSQSSISSSRASGPAPFNQGDVQMRQSTDPSADSNSQYRATQAQFADEVPDDQIPLSGQTSEPPYLRPVVLADDDKARRILQPTVSSILAKVDNLLNALERSRINHFGRSASEAPSDGEVSNKSRRKQQSRSSSNVWKSSPISAEQIVGRTRARRRSKPDEDSGSGSDYAPDDDDEAGSRASSTGSDGYRSRRRTKGNLRSNKDRKLSNSPETDPESYERAGLRDWSEVLGLASMTGWNERAVERAAKRCAALFGEGMTFRILDQNPALEAPAEPVEYTPSAIPGPESSRTTSPKRRPYWPPGTLSCPHTDCFRHHKEYRAPFEAVEHCIKYHGYDPRASDDEIEVVGELYGGVHVDGFLQTISNKRWRGRDKGPSEKRQLRKKRKRGASGSSDE
ncbi:hypothetical protein K432DRAFT_382813 [Lepidopterella palustris CBS 459.81]|uniref:Rrn9 domain-containing protein n=1 Tax=Lepidopterella palustris CBS 459.81 TaxID=1314670 RepID=A0A8E2E946_9PEZI|nr:hypothetical protein K432DRAFT_382813 [Lepidopterella palustris CBS 459.81]